MSNYQAYKTSLLLPFFERYGIAVPLTVDLTPDFDAAFNVLKVQAPEMFYLEFEERSEAHQEALVKNRRTNETNGKRKRLTSPLRYWR